MDIFGLYCIVEGGQMDVFLRPPQVSSWAMNALARYHVLVRIFFPSTGSQSRRDDDYYY